MDKHERKGSGIRYISRITIGLRLCGFLTLALSVAGAAGADLEFAHGLYQQQRYQLAAEEYKAFLADAKDNKQIAEARFFLAECLLQEGNPREAVRFYELVAQSGAKEEAFIRPSVLRAGVLHFQRQEYKEAEPFLHRFLRDYRGDAEEGQALYLVGEIELSAGNLDPARAALENALTCKVPVTGSMLDNVHFAQARLAERAGQRADAIQRYRALADKADSPLADDARVALGVLYFGVKEFASAKREFQKVVDDYPRGNVFLMARLNLGLSLLELGDAAGAFARLSELTPALETKVTAKPPTKESVSPKENAPAKPAKPATEAATEAEAVPARLGADAAFWAGQALAAQGEHGRAADWLRAAAQLYHDSPRVMEMAFHAARHDLQAQRPAAARQAFAAFANQYPRHPLAEEARYHEARAALAAKEWQATQNAYAALKAKSPRSEWLPLTAVLVAEALVAMGMQDQTLLTDPFAPLLAEVSDSGARDQIHYFQAVSLYQRGRRAEAVAALDKLSDKGDRVLRARADYVKGMALLELQRPDEAGVALTAFLASAAPEAKTGSLVVSALRALGQAQARGQRSDKSARDQWAARVSTLPEGARLFLDIADLHFDAGHHDDAAELYQRLLKLEKLDDSTRNRARIGLGWCYLEKNDPQSAQPHFSAAAESSANDAKMLSEAQYLLGIAAQRAMDDAGALAAFQTVARKYPDSEYLAEALRRAALLLTRANKPEAIEQMYRDIKEQLAGKPTLARVLWEQADWQLEQRQPQNATNTLRQLVTTYPDTPYGIDATIKLAELAQNSGDFKNAEKYLRSLDGKTLAPPQRANLLSRQGQLSLARQDHEDARRAFTALQQQFIKEPSGGIAFFWLGEVEFAKQQAEKATVFYQQVLDRADCASLHETARVRMVECHLLTRSWRLALDQAEKLLPNLTDPALRAETQYIQGRALQQLARFDDARATYEAIAGQKTQIAAKARFMMGETYFHQKRYDRALREFLKVEILYPHPQWQALGLLQASKCHQKLGQINEAETTLRRLSQRFPDTPAAVEGKKVLATLR